MQLRFMMKSKIQRATVTKTQLDYNGSIGIDKSLMAACDILANEKVQVLNFANGERFETYVIEESEGSGTIALYGPAARCACVGDSVCIISYMMADDKGSLNLSPKILKLDKHNRIQR